MVSQTPSAALHPSNRCDRWHCFCTFTDPCNFCTVPAANEMQLVVAGITSGDCDCVEDLTPGDEISGFNGTWVLKRVSDMTPIERLQSGCFETSGPDDICRWAHPFDPHVPTRCGFQRAGCMYLAVTQTEFVITLVTANLEPFGAQSWRAPFITPGDCSQLPLTGDWVIDSPVSNLDCTWGGATFDLTAL